MAANKRLQAIITMLYLPNDMTFTVMKKFLQKTGICHYLLKTADSQNEFSLFTREEVKQMIAAHEGHSLPVGLNALRMALDSFASPEDESSIMGQALAEFRQQLVFPEDAPNQQGLSGSQRALRNFYQVVLWFNAFMEKCANGVIDVDTLNEFKHTRGVVLQFKAAGNSMNPALAVVELQPVGDDILERMILRCFIYPFILSGQGNELAKVRKCRQCNTWFLGQRLSATFCTAKCRNIFHHLNRPAKI